MAMWTSAQENAISAPIGEGNILVSAAAGSGKTAVLVERIITKILSGKTDIDRLLVVTFTEAAASEMKEKIIIRLQKALEESKSHAEEERIQNQLRLSGGADITTIDAFCLRTIRNNFHVLGIDPNFFIADPAEAELMMDDAIEELFNRLYVENDERFFRLIDMYASNRDDRRLKSLVFNIYKFILSFAEPLEWLDEKAAMYVEDMSHSEWAQEYVIKRGCNKIGRDYGKRFRKFAAEMIGAASEFFDEEETGEDLYIISEENDYMNECWGNLWKGVCKCIAAAGMAENVADWDSAYEFYENFIYKSTAIDSVTPGRIPKKKLVSDEIWKYFCEKRNEIKKGFRTEYKAIMSESAGDFNVNVHSAELCRTIQEIVWLVKEFDKTYIAKKESRCIKEFHDIEHLAYKLFCENENIRSEYRDRYDEILIDEYQDTNGLQDAIFKKISNDNRNIFMVGDLKQSIYYFRGGDPTIFKDKSKSYIKDETEDSCIVLSQNFRSRQEILKSVNDVFSSVMSDVVGDVVYKGDELIVRDEERECYPEPISDNISEMHCISIISDDDTEELELPDSGGSVSDRTEAAYIADRIKEMLENGYQVYDKALKRYRNVQCRDITILAKSVRYVSDTYMQALSSRGIAAYVEIEDYFDRREIRLILTLISLINNHLQDIPLVAVMRSPIGGFSDNELGKVRLFNQNSEYFYWAVCDYGKNGDDAVLCEKCMSFIDSLRRWREYAKQKTVANLIWSIYSETGFYDFMGALEGGEEAQANLKLLYERAKQYEQSGFRGLFNFLRYIEKLRNRRDDLSGAKLIGENHDVVRIMTIHKSKGLEFPVVFLAGMGKKIRGKPNTESRVILHKELGFGLQYADAQKSYYKDTMMKNLVAKANTREELSETMRLLYVAMTRPKEKLIVTAVRKYSSEEKRLSEVHKWRNLLDIDGVMDTKNAASASSYADWICPAAMRCDNWKYVEANISSLSKSAEKAAEEEKNDEALTDELVNAVGKILDFSYKYPKSGAIPSKTSVSALKQMESYEEDNADMEAKPNEFDFSVMVKQPKFMRKNAQGNEIGTAHHQLMAYINLEGIKKAEDIREFINSEIARIIDSGQIDADAVTENMAEHCAEFFESELGARMLNSDGVYREQPFQIEIPAKLFDCTLDNSYDNETMILQGVIDCFFEEDGGIVLLDYKTDKVSSVDDIVNKYRLQLELYAEAIEKITKKTVKQKYLYLFSVKSVVEL
ncbi:MAG: helicase-exonuclease AddAB subunit AddA [Clostridia bacterium]